MKILFVCGLGKHRSKTAAELFKDRYETKYAGVFSRDNPVTLELLEWADVVVTMEDEHRIEILRKFPKRAKRIVTLHVSDVFGLNDPELKAILEPKLQEALGS